MRPDTGSVTTVEESTSERAYRELAEDHADRLYGIAILILGDPVVALQVMRDGFQRTWDALRRDQLFGDVVDTLYWSTTRGALRRVARSRPVVPPKPVASVPPPSSGAASLNTPQQPAASPTEP